MTGNDIDDIMGVEVKNKRRKKNCVIISHFIFLNKDNLEAKNRPLLIF